MSRSSRSSSPRWPSRALAIVFAATGAASLHLQPLHTSCSSRRDALLGAAGFFATPLLPAWSAPNPLCDPLVSQLKGPDGKEVYLVGTAHISQESAALVRNVIRAVKPDTVMIELDASRAGRMMPPGGGAPTLATAPPAPPEKKKPSFSPQNVALDLLQGKGDEAGTEAVGYGLSSLYKNLDEMGYQSGQEFVVAVNEARALGADVLLGDRDARKTLQRIREALVESVRSGALQRALKDEAPPPAFVGESLKMDAPTQMTPDNINAMMGLLKTRENTRVLADYIQRELPPLYTALIAERDEYMANSLLQSPGKRMVAVTGLAHMDGIERRFLSASAARGCPAR